MGTISQRDGARADTAMARAARAAPQSSVVPRRVSVLGATGSVGSATLDLIGRHAGAFEVDALTAHGNGARLAELAITHRAKLAVVADEKAYAELKSHLAGTGIEAGAGMDAVIDAASRPVDYVMAAIVGSAGLRPTLAAIKSSVRVGLANKECLVCAGALVMAAAKQHGCELLPVDSEHSAVFQALAGSDDRGLEKITITASGGPFRTFDAERLKSVTPEQALKHPNWTMGRKITIDSASLMNKGLELIEAFHLFPVSLDQLDVVVHPQSIIHALVAFKDGSVLAQLGMPDMRTPIAVSLAWPARMEAPTPKLDLVALHALTFEAPDLARFPALRIAREALASGGLAPAVLNGANEVAVEAFLNGEIRFLDIPASVEFSLEKAVQRGVMQSTWSLDDVIMAEASGRQLALEAISCSRASR